MHHAITAAATQTKFGVCSAYGLFCAIVRPNVFLAFYFESAECRIILTFLRPQRRATYRKPTETVGNMTAIASSAFYKCLQV